MPTYVITGPDGKKYRVTGEGTADQALAHIRSSQDRSEYDPASPEYQAKYGPTSAMGGGERFLAGAGKAFVDLARGAGQLIGKVSTDDVAASRERDAPLMQSGVAVAGNITGGIAAAAPALFVPGANTAVGAGLVGAAYGALQPSESSTERLTNTAVGGTTGAVSQYAGQKIAGFIGKAVSNRAATAQTRAAQNAVRDMTLAEARRAGYVVPPSTTNPTAVNRAIEGVSGKAATQQAAAVRNQQSTNRLIRQDLGLSENAPITREALKGIRERMGQVYKAVKNAGEVIVDDAYLDDLAQLSQGLDEIAADFPDANVGANEQINKLVDTLLRDRFKAGSAVEYIKQLRQDASANLSFAAAADPSKRALGHAQRDAAGALEDVLIRHLQSTGKGHLASRFDSARTMIAKTHSVEAALNEATGNVVATQLGTQLKRGKPLSGGIATVAKFARAFPRAAQEITHSPGVSALDAMVGGAGAVTVNPALVGIPAARMGARSAVLSGPYQNAMGVPSYSPKNGLLEILRAGSSRAGVPAAILGVDAVKQ